MASMPFHDKAFWSAVFFITGVLLASIFSGFVHGFLVIISLCLILIISLFAFSKNTFAILAVFIIIGSGYYFYTDSVRTDFVFSSATDEYAGIVSRIVNSSQAQNVDVVLDDPAGVKVRLTLQPFPEVKYGDKVAFTGVLNPADRQAKPYLKKDGIQVTVSFPKKIEVVGHNNGSPIVARLYQIRQQVINTFSRILPPQEATFMTGLTLGKGGGFPKEFLEKLSLTGTTHLVALSGQNISIIATGIIFLFGSLFRRRLAVIFSVIVILGFVVMTGAEASVVRAAFMAGIVFLAEQSGRIYQFRNSIAFAGLIMILINPYVLVFDVGFQLSFLALLGIVYLKPAIARFFKFSPEPGFFAWRVNLLTALAAQLAVLPILLSAFGSFSVLGIVANLLILEFIPLTMSLGFIIYAVSLLSNYLAQVFGWLARILLGYELGVINLFAKFPILVKAQSLSLVFGVLYYAGIAGFIIYASRKPRHV